MNYHGINLHFSLLDPRDRGGVAGYSKYWMSLEDWKKVEEVVKDEGFENGDYVEFHVTDDFILIISHCLEEEELRDVTIHCQYEHIFWLLHDLSHAMNDVISSEIYVDEEREERATTDAIDFLKAKGMNIPYGILETVRSEMEERFGYQPMDFVEYAGGSEVDDSLDLSEVA